MGEGLVVMADLMGLCEGIIGYRVAHPSTLIPPPRLWPLHSGR